MPRHFVVTIKAVVSEASENEAATRGWELARMLTSEPDVETTAVERVE